MNLLVFDFGGTSIKYGVWIDNEILHQSSFPTPKSWDELTPILLEIKNQFIDCYSLSGAAFSFPGAVDSAKGEIRGISAVPYTQHFPLKQALTDLLDLPVAMANDANCAALAELWKGAAKTVDNALFIVIGTGIGGVVIIDGKIHYGRHLFGGEFGFTLLDEQTSFSELATAVHVARRYCKRKGLPINHYSGEEVFKLADEEEDPIALEEVNQFYKYLSIGLFNLQTSFDPDIIVIGGGLSANDRIITTLQNKLTELLAKYDLSEISPRIEPCHYRNGANLVGAVKNFFDEYGHQY